jgi:hypothetical protein
MLSPNLLPKWLVYIPMTYSQRYKWAFRPFKIAFSKLFYQAWSGIVKELRESTSAGMLGQVGIEFYLEIPGGHNIEKLLKYIDLAFTQFAKYGAQRTQLCRLL